MKRLLPALLLVLCSSPVEAVFRSWTNSAGGNWFVAANWSPNGIPGVIDVANITNNGSYTVQIATGTVVVAAINLGGTSGSQTLALGTTELLNVTNFAVRPNGTFSMTSGSLHGQVVVEAGGQLVLDTSGNKFLDTLTLINRGTVTWNAGQLLNGGQPATVVSNGGQWFIQGNDSFNLNIFQTNMPVWINSGLLRKAAGASTSQINNFNFFNTPSGTVDTQIGTLQFGGGPSNTLGGSFTTSAGAATLLQTGTYYDAGGTATGNSQFASGTLNLRTNIIPGLLLTGGNVFIVGAGFQNAGAITNLALDGATLQGTNRVGGALTFNSGSIHGQLTVQAAGQLNLSTIGNKFLDTLALINQGVVNWNAGQLLNGGQPATVVSNGGQWLIQGNDSFNFNIFQTNQPAWINAGLLRKSGGASQSQINNFNFFNTPSGTVDVLTGTLRIGGGASNTLGGTFTTSGGGVMDLQGGTYFDAGGTATGDNRFSSGTLNLRTDIIPGLLLTGGDVLVGPAFQNGGAITNLTLDGSALQGTSRVAGGTLTFNAGAVHGQLTIQSGGQLNLNTAGNKFLDTLTLINQGIVTWNAGQLLNGGQPATVVSNGGQWFIQGNDSFNFNIFQTNSPTWINSGLLRKAAGASASQINNFNFFNTPSGSVDTQIGTLQLGGGPSNTLGGSFTTSGGAATLLQTGTYYDAGGTATGNSQFASGTLNLRTNIIPGLLLTGGNVFIVGAGFQNAGAITNLALDGATLQGTNRVSGGALTFNSGSIHGQLTVQPNGQLQMNTSGNKFLDTLALINQGVVNWNQGQLLNGGQPATVVSNGGQWLIQGDDSFNFNIFQTNMPVWFNHGLLRKTGGALISQINNFNFFNAPAATVDVQIATLRFNGGPTNTLGGAFTTSGTGAMELLSGTFYDAGGTAAGTNRFAGGTLNLRTNIIPGLFLTGGNVFIVSAGFQNAGAITNLTLDGAALQATNRVANGALIFNSGSIHGQLTVQPTGQLQLNTSGNKFLDTLALINQGVVNWNQGQLLNGGTPATVVSNGGQWVIQGNDSFNFNVFQTNTPTWINTGQLRKNGGPTVSQMNNFNFATPSSSLIQVDIGTLQLPAGFTNTAGTLRLNSGTLQANGALVMTGGTLEGNGTLGAHLVAGGVVSPGLSPGSIAFNSGLNFAAGTTLIMEGVGTVPVSQYDQLSVTGLVAIANCTLQVNSLPIVSPGATFFLVLNDGADTVQGTFSGLPENAAMNVSGQPFRIHYSGGTGNDITLARDSGPAVGPQLSNGAYDNTTFRFTGSGINAQVYRIQATTNFLQWTNIGFATGDVLGNFSFVDTNAFRFRYRFYRTTN